MKYLALCSLLFLGLFVNAQSQHYQNLLDTATARKGALFAAAYPIKKVDLELSEMKWYVGNYGWFNNKKLDTVMFAQIIRNTANADTTPWQEQELNKLLLVKNGTEKISKEHAIQKFGLTDQQQISKMENTVNNFNALNGYYRNVYYFARPVFDDNKQFAVVQWDNGHAGKAGGGGVILFELKGDKWIEAGTILHWVH